jgi:hypothetical protein
MSTMGHQNQPTTQHAEQTAAVVIPIYKATLSALEQQAIASVRSHLSAFDCYLAYPMSLQIQWDTTGFKRLPMSEHPFQSIQNYSAMCHHPSATNPFDLQIHQATIVT